VEEDLADLGVAEAVEVVVVAEVEEGKRLEAIRRHLTILTPLRGVRHREAVKGAWSGFCSRQREKESELEEGEVRERLRNGEEELKAPVREALRRGQGDRFRGLPVH
jgi:hypothetical protein